MSDAPLSIGIEEIDRKYEILDLLGEGGMGEIYKGHHRHLEEVRVLKTIRPQLKHDAELQARFLREAQVATRLRHENIAAIHDFVVGDDGMACIVMEFIEGRDLVQTQRSPTPLSQAQILEVGLQTLEALDYLHQRNVVHRDISPDNIMLTRSHRGELLVKLIDMGIAKPLDGAQFETRAAMFIGKVRYSSPEQLGASGDAPIDGRSDLYSLGVALYELLTGILPITGTDQTSLIAGHLFHPPRSFDETDPQGKVSQPLRTVLLRALAKSPDDRYADAREFATQLAAAAAGASESGSHDRTILESEPLQPSTVPTGPGGDIGTQPEADPGEAQPTADPTTVSPPGHDPTTMSPSASTPAGATVAAPPRGQAVSGRDEATTLSPEARPEPGTAVSTPPAGTFVATEGGVPWRSRRSPLVAGLALVALLAVATFLFLRARAAPSASALAALDFGDFHAVVIGNDRYQYLPELESAARDARELAGLLENRYGFEVHLLLDATRAEIVTQLSSVASSMTPRDNLLVFYAGHGRIDGRNQSGFWQPVDADPLDTSNWISTTHTLSALLDQTEAQRVLVVADSCFSGALAAPGNAEETAPPPRSASEIEEALGYKSRLLLTSGGLSPVLDSGGGDHSIFARELLEALEANDAVLAASGLFQTTVDAVADGSQALGMPQRPRFAPIPRTDHSGGEFFFVARSGA